MSDVVDADGLRLGEKSLFLHPHFGWFCLICSIESKVTENNHKDNYIQHEI